MCFYDQVNTSGPVNTSARGGPLSLRQTEISAQTVRYHSAGAYRPKMFLLFGRSGVRAISLANPGLSRSFYQHPFRLRGSLLGTSNC